MGTTREDVATLMDVMHKEEQGTREQGQKEYAHHDHNALRNFEMVGELVPCPHCGKPIGRVATLMVYLLKHMFGVLAWVGGHKSQREDVRGRVKDARVYLALFRAMVEEGDREEQGRQDARRYYECLSPGCLYSCELDEEDAEPRDEFWCPNSGGDRSHVMMKATPRY